VLVVRSKNGVFIRLSEERWAHICSRHPEMETQRERVIETIQNPDYIQEGDFGDLLAMRQYAATPLTRKQLVVAYRETSPDDGFVLTAYFTSRPSAARRIVWKP
jgi:hypothetical protein